MAERRTSRVLNQRERAESRSEAKRRVSERKQADESWRATFDFFDMDHSGAISVSELQQCLRALGQNLTAEQVLEMINRSDQDGNGELDYEEFVQIMAGGRTITRDMLKKYFETLDADGSGYVTTAEFRHSLTALNQGLSDSQMDEIMDMYDNDGGGQIDLPEFELLVKELGLEVVDGEDELEDPRVAEVVRMQSVRKEEVEQPDIEKPRGFVERLMGCACLQGLAKAVLADGRVAPSDAKLAEILNPLADKDGKVCLTQVSKAVDIWKKYHSVSDTDPESDPALHWQKGRVKKGLGEVIYKANHIALIVSDVGRAAAFYSDVIGLQQIRRPDFDRHGAWFTMGNMELHLIKGIPIVHSGSDLIVGHISIETYDIDKVPGILKAAGVPFRQNVSVPKGGMASGSGTNASNKSSNIVKQFFLRDPDGYYIEICNCDVLTKYCLGNIREIAGYDQGAALDVAGAGIYVNLGLKIASQAIIMSDNLVLLGEELAGKSIEEIAKRVGCQKPAKEVDELIFKKLLVRRTVYGDVCQNESEDDLKQILLWADNHLPLAMKIMKVRANGDQIFAPPAFFEEGSVKVVPDKIKFSKSKSTLQ